MSLRNPNQKRVYLSLGDREKNTKKAVMRRVEENTATLHERFGVQGIAWVVSDRAEGGSLP